MNNLKDRVTIYQVAQAANVSLATVSRVINNKGNVTEKTRERVEETIRRLGYKPSGLAQALATNKSTNIGVIIPSANYVYISNLLSGISDVAKEQGFILTLFTTSHSREETLATIEKVITSHVDGAIIFDDELGEEDIATINSYSVPTVVLNKKIFGERLANIRFNYYEVLGKIIASYYENGGEKIMTFLHVHNGGRLLAMCEKAFVEYHMSHRLPYHIVNCDDSYNRTYQDFLEYFKQCPQGYIIAYRDSIASAISNAAIDSGLRIPEDVEILSIVGTKYAHIFRPSLSAIHIDMVDVGKRAMFMLTDLINESLVDKGYRFEGTYVRRQSTLK